MLRRETQQRLKCGHWHAAAIEPKHEFIDVVWQVLRADAVVRALEPGLEVRKYSTDYMQAEADAKRDGAGIWRGEFTPPWEWRQQDRRR